MLRYFACLAASMIILYHKHYRIREEGTEEEKRIEKRKRKERRWEGKNVSFSEHCRKRMLYQFTIYPQDKP